MKPISIGNATSVYEIASKCEITRIWVDHAGLADVSSSVRALVQSLNSEAEAEFWQRTLGPIRRIAFALCSTPLPFDRAVAAAGVEWDKVQRQVRLCQQQYPDFYAALADLVKKLQDLTKEVGSPFSVPLELLHRESGGMSVVLRNPRMNQVVASYFAATPGLQNARIVSARQLRETQLRHVLVAIGPCGWFPDYVFSAPRAEHIYVVSFRWIRDPWKPGAVFLSGTNSHAEKTRTHLIGVLPQLKDETVPHGQPLTDIDPTDLLPSLPSLGKVGLRITSRQQSADDETLPARLCQLSGGRAVFVSADGNATSLVIDLSEVDDSIVRRVPVDELEPELYLLLRTSGGGDFIAPLADRILGLVAAERRAQQADWKDRLVRVAQERFGPLPRSELAARIANLLRAENLTDVHPANIHYWMSSKCIRPRNEDDFVAVLTFAGLAGKTQEFWVAMGEIDRAHRRAGHAIRQMLIEKIASLSLEPLERDGEMIFDLGEQDGGTLSAFQITEISAEAFEMPADRIGVLLDPEDYPWLA